MQFPNTTVPVSEYNRFSFRIPVSEYNRAVSESQFPNTTVPVSEYNRRVSEYNRGVSEYNRRVSEYNRPVSEYNRDRLVTPLLTAFQWAVAGRLIQVDLPLAVIPSGAAGRHRRFFYVLKGFILLNDQSCIVLSPGWMRFLLAD